MHRIGPKYLRRFFSVSLVAILALGVVACERTSEYRTFTLTRGIAHFELQYPRRYRIQKTEVADTYTDVSLFGSGTSEAAATLGFVFVQSYRGQQLDVKTHVDKEILDWQGSTTFPGLDHFVLLDRTSVEVAGMKGERVKYSYDSAISNTDLPSGFRPARVITDEVYLAGDDSLWILTWMFKPDVSDGGEQVDKDFEHVLDSLKVLGQKT
jgi:hypothetical protein